MKMFNCKIGHLLLMAAAFMFLSLALLFSGAPRALADERTITLGSTFAYGAGPFQIVPSGYGLTAIGYGSDDTRCFVYIKTAPVASDGNVNFSQVSGWQNAACPDGGGSSAKMVEYQYDNHITVGWSWGASTDGGSPGNSEYPYEACYYQEYAPLNNINSRSTWGALYDGNCNEKLYLQNWLKQVVYAPYGRVIVAVGLSLANDASMEWIGMQTRHIYPPPDAQPYSNNIPSSFNASESKTVGSDGQPLRITMQNTGGDWISDNVRDVAGTGVGTCQVDTNSDSILDCPSTTNAAGTSCTVQRTNWSSIYQLDHTTSNFTQGAVDPTYYDKRTSQTCTIISQPSCSNPSPSCQTSQSVCVSSGYCSVGSCSDPISCSKPPMFGGCGGTWILGCNGTWNAAAKVASKTTSGDPNILTNGTADFFLNSLTAPSAGTYIENWQMKKITAPEALFGSQLVKNISVSATTGTIQVNSVNSVTGAPVSSSWYFPSPPADPCGGSLASCSGNSATYSEQQAGIYTLSAPFSGQPNPAGYTLGSILPSQTQTLIALNTATYTIKWVPTYALTVSKSGTGTGTVTSSPTGINCGSDCTENYTSGTSVTLTASPSAGSTFAGWSGDTDCSDGNVTMNVNKTCTATFNLPSPDFTLNSSNAIHVTILAGGPTKTSTDTTITVTSANGFSSNVTLSASSDISGAIYNFTTNPLTSSQYSIGSVFNVTIPSATTKGLHTITIQGVDGGLIRTVNVILNVESYNTGWKEF